MVSIKLLALITLSLLAAAHVIHPNATEYVIAMEAATYNGTCYTTSPGTCSLGLWLSTTNINAACVVLNHACNVLGVFDGLEWEDQTTLAPPALNLPYEIQVTPHFDNSQHGYFTYEGKVYQDGWTFIFWDAGQQYYEWLYFKCEK